MPPIRAVLLAPLLMIAGCDQDRDESPEAGPVPSPAAPSEAVADTAKPEAADKEAGSAALSVATFPNAMRGKWRETDGPAPTAAQCDGTAGGNIGKVMEVREKRFSIFETGGTMLDVSQREDGLIRAQFDTTYADTPTRDELTFSVDPVALTLTVTNHDAGEQRTTAYKRCPA
ncbi:hypothetical protein [Parerythrobacter lacustris]|uniref:Lipocalin-like domain-containing protein n=1 Tax=Parerythrobacter lacustris TaxID=2969984 RepID=A0ABT1XQB8_9SPHN|nr:hypothetical protein [Parerythrobacter lacustris]MCR2832830.1 hypothetical protein [Parerythrobacter lacustris]